MDYVDSSFRDNFRRDPRLGEDGKPSRVLSKQYKGYKNKDPNESQQKALPFCVVKQVLQDQVTAKAQASGHLIVGAMFFAMRSCEYLHAPANETRRTKVLNLHNLRFFQHGKALPHNYPQLYTADTIAITFVFQKSDERNEEVAMHCTADPFLCPVKVYADLVSRIRTHPKANDSSPVHLFTDEEGNLKPITSDHIRLTLRAAATLIGEDRLGFKIKDIGTHSIRSGSAMAMYLGDVPVYTIMIVGRWSSDAFLRYIRR